MSLTGLNEGDFTSINVLRGIGLGSRAGRGANNQVIKSDGTNANWSDEANTEYTGSGAILLTGTNFTLSVSGLQGLDFSGIQAEAYASTGELYQVEVQDAGGNPHYVLAIKQ
jgi:hypothetical protein